MPLNSTFIASIFWCCLSLFSSLVWAEGAEPNKASLPPELLKTLQAYAHIQAYSERATAQVTVQTEKGNTVLSRVVEGVVILAKRPNLLMLTLNVPEQSRYQTICSNGKTLFVFDSFTSKYTKGPTAPSLSALIPLLRRRALVSFFPSPFYFFAVSNPLSNFRDFHLDGRQERNGRTYLLISALSTPIPPSPGRRAISVRWTWYIDTKTGWIERVEGNSQPFAVRRTLPGKRVPELVQALLRIEYQVLQEKADPAVRAKDFVFTVPKTATLVPGLNPPWLSKRAH